MSFPFSLRDAGGLPQEDTTKMHYLDLRMRLEDKESPGCQNLWGCMGMLDEEWTLWISLDPGVANENVPSGNLT